jgi:DNA polymerase sigma
MDSPWSNSDTLSIANGMVRLSKEILDFEKYIAPTESETRKRSEAQKTVKDFIRKALPEEYTIEVFGSHVTTLTFPSSDIDFNIQFKYPVVKPVKTLNFLYKKGRQFRFFPYDTEFVRFGRTPVIKCKLDNGVSVDITVQNPAPSSDRTIAWIKQYPELKPLFMVLKQALSSFRVNHKKNFEPLSAKFSGLASFGLICLIVSYLQVRIFTFNSRFFRIYIYIVPLLLTNNDCLVFFLCLVYLQYVNFGS